MAQIKVDIPDFTLVSSWTCKYGLVMGEGYHNDQTSASTATKTVTFDYSIPDGAIVQSAKIHSSWSGTLYGISSRKVAGETLDDEGFVIVDNLDASSMSLDVVFSFVALRDAERSHYQTTGLTVGEVYTHSHQSTATVSDVYLLIEFEDTYTPPEFVPYTDPNPVAGETYVKAVHMTELQENVNRLRIAKGLTAYAFTAITAMQTSLAGWNAHVLEIRAALDEVSTEHDAWLALDVNRPRLDVLLQLRSMVEVLAA